MKLFKMVGSATFASLQCCKIKEEEVNLGLPNLHLDHLSINFIMDDTKSLCNMLSTFFVAMEEIMVTSQSYNKVSQQVTVTDFQVVSIRIPDESLIDRVISAATFRHGLTHTHWFTDIDFKGYLGRAIFSDYDIIDLERGWSSLVLKVLRTYLFLSHIIEGFLGVGHSNRYMTNDQVFS